MTRVLIVDDHEDVREIFGVCLKRVGMEVLYASNGQEALQLAESQRPDVMLLDFHMPEMSGDKVLDVVRESDWGREMRVIAVTATSIHQAQYALDKADVILYKPVELQALTTIVQRLL